MKKQVLFSCLVATIFATSIISCKKNDFSNSLESSSQSTEQYLSREELKEFELSTSFVSLATLIEITDNLKDEYGSFIEDPELIADAISPLVENGRALHEELIANVSESDEWVSMSPEEIDSITNITDIQRAELSFLYALSNPLIEEQAAEAGISAETIKDCVGVALGIYGIKHLLTTLTTAPTVSSAIGILKWVGKRYLSYIGIAWMVWDFVDCVSSF